MARVMASPLKAAAAATLLLVVAFLFTAPAPAEAKRALLQVNLYPNQACNMNPPYTCEQSNNRWACPGCSKCGGDNCYGDNDNWFYRYNSGGYHRAKQLKYCAQNPLSCGHSPLWINV